MGPPESELQTDFTLRANPQLVNSETSTRDGSTPIMSLPKDANRGEA
jgi:hypothetical protein